VNTVYRIAKFEEVFTKRDARKAKVLHWVSVPTGFQSNGYQSLVEDFGDEAPAIYGAWCALVAVAARCPIEGVLSTSRGRPITPERAANIAFMPAEPFRKLFKWAASESVGWLEVVTQGEEAANVIRTEPEDHPDKPRTASGPHNTTGQDTTGQNITSHDIDAGASCPASPNASEPDPPKRSSRSKGEHPGFRAWYAAYPRRVKPKAAAAAYAKAVKEIQGREGLGGKDPVGFLLNRAKAFASSGAGKGEIQFVPHPATWLNAGSYDDDEACWVRSPSRELTAARGSPTNDPRNAMGVNAEVKQLIRSGALAAYADPPTSRGES
jgi:hypothetical protein